MFIRCCRVRRRGVSRHRSFFWSLCGFPDEPVCVLFACLRCVVVLVQSNLRRATTADVMAYFHNVWDLTDTLFSALRDDSVFYSIPDKLRRPLIFYFAHPAAVYANKMHLAGLMGTSRTWLDRGLDGVGCAGGGVARGCRLCLVASPLQVCTCTLAPSWC